MPSCVSQRWPGLGGAEQPGEQRKQLLGDRSNEGKKKRRKGITCSVIMIIGRKTLGVSSVKAFVQRNVSVKDGLVL